jgi:hypothetical protein
LIAVKEHMDVGSEPVSLLLLRKRVANFDKPPRVVGIELERQL